MRLLSLALLLLFSGISARAEPPSVCSGYIGNCTYYACEDAIRDCGPDGYLIRFGYHYCGIFQDEVHDHFSRRGRQWLDRVASCLQEAIDPLPEALSCGELENAAIASHKECYLETGFCELGFLDKLRVFEVVHAELKDPRISRIFSEIRAGCKARR